ncbi:glycosyltransferase family 39 protein [Cytophagaceae bacterium DM2B3-1]|uniref:Glycosyltransferase family 39 protein n=1 Tax=Xanthocytophaga flava TaxID=3048013 RepID=A0ABT7CQT2_9BACT|nr:glycosyltransferase family 39 protein [Xanthocytophaga flavus]MDJ1496112.1 glycosyltransferase family 39 protein [Xanthocytophaga flavus]
MMRFCLLFLFIFAILFIFLSFDGYYFYDDTTYAHYAFYLSQGKLVLNEEIFSHRLGIIIPTALAYKLSGVNDISTIWISVVCTLICLYLIYFFLKKYDPKVAIWAMILFGLDFYTLFFSNKLYPDVSLTCMALLSAISLHQRNDQWGKPLLFCVANFWGFLCKETIVYLLPFYLLICIYDWRQKQHLLFWKRAFIIGFILLAGYFGFYYLYTSNPLYRFQIIQDGHYVATYNYFHKPASALIPRLTYEPVIMLIHSGMIICIVAALPFLFRRNFWNWSIWTDELFWSRLAFCGLCMFWGFTTSFKYYNPNALFPRMILFLIPFFAIASSFELSRLSAKKSFALAMIFLIVAAISWYTGIPNQAFQYGLLAIGWGFVGGLYQFTPSSFVLNKQLYLPLITGLLLVHPVYSMLKPSESGYTAEKHLIQKYLSHPVTSTLVFTDNKLMNGVDFYYQFNKPTSIQFLPYEKLLEQPKQLTSSTEVFVLINSYSVEYFRLIGTPPPIYIDSPPVSWQLIANVGGIRLYKVPSI